MERPQRRSTISDWDSVRLADGNGGDPAVKFRLCGNYRATNVPDWATHGQAQFALVALDCANFPGSSQFLSIRSEFQLGWFFLCPSNPQMPRFYAKRKVSKARISEVPVGCRTG